VMRIIPIPCLSDNYAYLLIDEGAAIAATVDPVEPAKVLAAAEKENVRVTTILTTHNHHDHAGGNAEFKKLKKDVIIYGGKGDGALAVEKEVWDGDTVNVGSLQVQVLATPCHTIGHVSYYVPGQGDEPGAVFTGDTLFIASCGNFNTGSPEQMHEALYKKIGTLPPTTQVFVGHEYTVNNLKFATTVEPDNVDVTNKLKWATEKREAGKFTIPSTIAEEWKTNPFMRCGEKTVQQYAGSADIIKTLATVRARKTEWGRAK